ncbi:MAG: hypothetical protein H6841_04340 [Planctomycetes bacterium]|nr:hypothetical protein [Planctomycetota bacterium]MCB9934720.1 hypothetical protein [Planctomycetota bacterium]
MKLCAALLAGLLLAACASGDDYFRLEEYGEGWKLEIKEEGETFRASWVEGEHRSTKLVGYHDDPGSQYYIVNTLYLELDEDGSVINGRLKRVVLPEFEKRSYYERNAQWFRVLEGNCLLDKQLNGTVRVRCEGGYEFNANVEPIENLEVTRPEKE